MKAFNKMKKRKYTTKCKYVKFGTTFVGFSRTTKRVSILNWIFTHDSIKAYGIKRRLEDITHSSAWFKYGLLELDPNSIYSWRGTKLYHEQFGGVQQS